MTHRRLGRFGNYVAETAIGADFRRDSVGGPLGSPIETRFRRDSVAPSPGLYPTRATERLSIERADDVDQSSIGLFADTEVEWSRKVRSTFGLRGDIYNWNVRANTQLNSGSKTSGILSPKVSAACGPWRSTEFYANWGMGFHSNSALGITLAVDPFTGEAATASPPFARAYGTEFGVRTMAVSRLQTTATIWYLSFDSELIYVGDSGSTEDGPASRRLGVEVTNYFYPHPWTTMDLDVSFSRARFPDLPTGENFIPGSLNRVISAGLAIELPTDVGDGPFGALRLRHFGPRPLLEDNSVQSEATSIVNAEIGYKFSEVTFALRPVLYPGRGWVHVGVGSLIANPDPLLVDESERRALLAVHRSRGCCTDSDRPGKLRSRRTPAQRASLWRTPAR